MQRRLESYDVFEKLTEGSLSTAQYELCEAEDVLGSLLERSLTFHSFDKSNVIYETSDGTYIRARYTVSPQSVVLEGLEEIVIDESSERAAVRNNIAEMIEAIVDDNGAKADSLWDHIVGVMREHYRRDAANSYQSRLEESRTIRNAPLRRTLHGKKKTPMSGHRRAIVGAISPAERSKRAKEGWKKRKLKGKVAQSTQKRLLSMRQNKMLRQDDPAKKKRELFGMVKPNKKFMLEWNALVNNVYGYANYVESGDALAQTQVKYSANGNISAVALPSSKTRNEGKILSYGLKTIKTDVKILRENALRLSMDREFCDAVADLRRHNRMSDNKALEESLGNIVSRWSSVLYLHQNELARILGEALANVGVANYDDTSCAFMAEGILRVAHDAYTDRVARIRQLAQAPVKEGVEDLYEDFQNAVYKFYAGLDESTALEMKVFEDLYNAALDVRRLALDCKNESLRQEAVDFVGDLEAVLEGQETPSLELATTVASWLEAIVETNLETDDWDVVKVPHETVSGDHPQMSKNAAQPYKPSADFSGDWGDPAPMIGQDDMNYRGSKHPDEARYRSWGNKGGSNVYPDLENPYVPKPLGDYTLGGEPGVDKNHDSGLAQWQDAGKTWGSGLENPYVPASVQPKVNSDNRAEDKDFEKAGLQSSPNGADRLTSKSWGY